MAVIKIVPMPGVPGPRGEQGQRGYQGDTGLTGPQGEPGESANTGDFEFDGANITAHEDITIGVDVVPGVINLSAYAGVNIQTAPQFGLYVNGIEPENKVLTESDLVTIMSGATGSFESSDGKTVTVVNGLITSIE